MMGIRILGIILVVCGASGFGFGAAIHLKRTLRQLAALDSAMQLMECELRFTHPVMPKLCRTVAESADGAVAELFRTLSVELSDSRTQSTEAAMQKAIEKTKRLCLPSRAVFSLLELGETLGKYDLTGQLSVLASIRKRLAIELSALEREQVQRTKTYATLGICAGIAVVILIL